MEDRYLFKAKTAKIVDTYNNDVEDGVWVHGSLRCDVGKYTIFQFETERADYVEYEIDPTTICQCTGLKDKNGKFIWEGDIVWDSDERAFYEIIWNQEDMCWNVEDADGHKSEFEECYGSTIEVNGNRFDNPELLESEG